MTSGNPSISREHRNGVFFVFVPNYPFLEFGTVSKRVRKKHATAPQTRGNALHYLEFDEAKFEVLLKGLILLVIKPSTRRNMLCDIHVTTYGQATDLIGKVVYEQSA